MVKLIFDNRIQRCDFEEIINTESVVDMHISGWVLLLSVCYKAKFYIDAYTYSAVLMNEIFKKYTGRDNIAVAHKKGKQIYIKFFTFVLIDA